MNLISPSIGDYFFRNKSVRYLHSGVHEDPWNHESRGPITYRRAGSGAGAQPGHTVEQGRNGSTGRGSRGAAGQEIGNGRDTEFWEKEAGWSNRDHNQTEQGRGEARRGNKQDMGKYEIDWVIKGQYGVSSQLVLYRQTLYSDSIVPIWFAESH